MHSLRTNDREMTKIMAQIPPFKATGETSQICSEFFDIWVRWEKTAKFWKGCANVNGRVCYMTEKYASRAKYVTVTTG